MAYYLCASFNILANNFMKQMNFDWNFYEKSAFWHILNVLFYRNKKTDLDYSYGIIFWSESYIYRKNVCHIKIKSVSLYKCANFIKEIKYFVTKNERFQSILSTVWIWSYSIMLRLLLKFLCQFSHSEHKTDIYCGFVCDTISLLKIIKLSAD